MNPQRNFYWIWPRSSTVQEDGSINFKTSGWDRGEIHWSSSEIVAPSSGEFRALNWIHQNRDVLPALLEKSRIPVGIERIGRLVGLTDGIHFLGDAKIVAGWGEQASLPLQLANPEQSETLRVLVMLTGANCLVFLDGRCEAALSVASEATEESVAPAQALSFIRSLANDAPQTPDSLPQH